MYICMFSPCPAVRYSRSVCGARLAGAAHNVCTASVHTHTRTVHSQVVQKCLRHVHSAIHRINAESAWEYRRGEGRGFSVVAVVRPNFGVHRRLHTHTPLVKPTHTHTIYVDLITRGCGVEGWLHCVHDPNDGAISLDTYITWACVSNCVCVCAFWDDRTHALTFD